MTSEQIVRLRKGQRVKVKLAPGCYFTVDGVRVCVEGQRVIELSASGLGSLTVGADQIVDVLEAA